MYDNQYNIEGANTLGQFCMYASQDYHNNHEL